MPIRKELSFSSDSYLVALLHPRPAEIVSLIPRCVQRCVGTSATIWDLSVSRRLFVEHQKVPPVGLAASLCQHSRTQNGAILSSLGLWLQMRRLSSKQTNKRSERDSEGFFSRALTRSDLFTEVACLICKCAFLIPDDVLLRWLQTGV